MDERPSISASSSRKSRRSCPRPEKDEIHEIKHDGFRTLIIIDEIEGASGGNKGQCPKPEIGLGLSTSGPRAR